MKIRLPVFLFLICVPTQTQAHANATDQQPSARCLRRLESRLGKPATSKAAVYSLSAVHAMELEFDKGCQIIRVDIAPKYFWESEIPEWVEPRSAPELSWSEYREFLAKVSKLRPIGILIRRGNSEISVVTNSKQYTWDEYENVFINRVMHCCDDKFAFAVDIYFLQNVTGKIDKIKPPARVDAIPRRVMIRQKWYVIPSNQKVSVGKRVQLRAAGPMSQFF